MSHAIALADMRALIERILSRYELLETGKSPMGSQIDHMAVADPHCTKAPSSLERIGLAWAKKSHADDKHAQFAYLSALADRWTAEEEEVLVQRMIPATLRELRDRNPPEDGERIRWTWRGDLRIETDANGTVLHHRTLAGEVCIHDCDGSEDCAWDDCPKVAGRVAVKGPVPKYPTVAEVAARLGMKVYQVRELTTSAYEKLRAELERRYLAGNGTSE